MNFNDYEERGFLQRYGFVLGIGAVGLVIGALVVGQISKGGKPAPTPIPQLVMIRPLPPPPPPPPPPPEPPKEVEQKMIEQTPVDQPEPKPDSAPKAEAPVTTSLTGPGNDAFGLGHGGGGGSGGGGRGSGSRFGWFAAEVQQTIQAALSRNPGTRDAQFSQRVRIWADASGRVVRIKLVGSTGDAALDQAIEQSLNGVQLQDAPPADLPMPIVMRITARRPS